MTERDAIILIITSRAGFAVSFQDLAVYRLEDGTFAVDLDSEQRIWKTAPEAVTDFLVTREAGKLGYDFEGAKE